MTAPSCTRALVLWCAFFGIVLNGLVRYGVLPSAEGAEGYLAGIYERSRTTLFYQLMIAVFVGCALYTVALVATLGQWLRDPQLGAPGTRQRTAILAGLGNTGPGAKDWKEAGPVVLSVAANQVRDAAVLFPAVGFIGTVVGVSLAIGGLGDVLDSGETAPLLEGLRIAFDTTLIGLVASVVLTALLHLVHVRSTMIRVRTGIAGLP